MNKFRLTIFIKIYSYYIINYLDYKGLKIASLIELI